MRTEHIFVIWSCIRIKGEVSSEKNWFKSPPHPSTPSSFPSDPSRAFPLLQDFFVCASVVSYVVFLLSLFVLISLLFLRLGKLRSTLLSKIKYKMYMFFYFCFRKLFCLYPRCLCWTFQERWFLYRSFIVTGASWLLATGFSL